jgi:protoporphyrinogen oxidase
MNIAIVGAGISGLTAAYELTKAGHVVCVFEKESYLGGLAYGFKEKNWDWSLEYAYHHLFTNDNAILNFVKELGLENKLITKRPITATLYDGFMYQLDSAKTLLTFPGLSFLDRIRTGLLIAAMKFNPFWQPLERSTAKEIALAIGGIAGWKTIWEPLMTGKFGEYADRVAASWLWARIVKRTPRLMYFEGGFHTFIETLAEKITQQGGNILTNTRIFQIKTEETWTIMYGKKKTAFDKVLLTIPTPLAKKLLIPHASQLEAYFQKPCSIPHLHAQVMILKTKEPILNDIYWLNITNRSFPFLAVVAHTNFIDKSHYGGNHITYIGNYLPLNHPFLKMKKQALLKTFMPYLKKLNPNSKLSAVSCELFVGPFAQPVHEKNYSTYAPKLQTPMPNLYLANMDSIYPWDRGTNYAVELGQKAAAEMVKT